MATAPNTNINIPYSPFLNDQTGRPNQEWLQWLMNPQFITVNLGSALPVTSGGTGLTTIPTAGQLLIGNGSGYTLNPLTPGAGIGVTNGVGVITVANTGVLSNIASSGISVSSATGNVTIANTGVLSWSGGSTGLTPATATTGAVTLAGTLGAGYGGTGLSTYAIGDLLYASGATALSRLADVATGSALISGGVTTAPSWGKIGLTTHVSGTLPIGNGGTNGTATAIAGAIAYGTGSAYAFTAAGTSGQVLTSAGAGTPTWTTPTTGTVTAVSVVSANGLAGTSSGGATPALTLSTTVTGLLKGNGTAISAATSGTDYAPATSGTSILYGNGSGGFSNVTIGTGVAFTAGTLSATGSGGTVTSVAALTLGTTGTDLSSTVANGTTTPVITLQVPTASATNRGALSAADWTTFNNKGSGTVTSVTGTAPVVSSGGATPAISMAAATTSVNGYLTSTDWNTFNGKQPAGSYLVSGGALGTPSSGTVTNLTGTASININGTVGATTPATGAFTTLGASTITTTGATVDLAQGGVTPIITVGNASINAASYIRLNSTNTYKNWEIATNGYVVGLSFTPSTVVGGNTYTTPVLNILDTGITITGTLGATGVVTFSNYGAGAATFSAAGVISSVSDETWKVKDGAPVDTDAMLNKLKPGYWYYNNEKKETFGKDRQLGFYAQNVNAAIGPEAAPEPEQGKPWGYYDRSVLAVTVMSLQKALSTIESLTARIAALELK